MCCSGLAHSLSRPHHTQFLTLCNECNAVMLSRLPVNQWVILTSVILYLEHPNSWYIPLEVELDQCSWWRGLSCHHPLIHTTLHITCRVAPIGAASGWCGNVRRSRVRLLDVVCVVGNVREFDNNQIHCLVSLAGGVGGDTGERASVLHLTDDNVQSSVSVDKCSGGIRDQFTLRRDPVNGWLWVTSCLTP